MEKSLALLRDSGGGGGDAGGAAQDAQLELGLGLSLGGGGAAAEKTKGPAYGRILTAKDFPNGFSSAGTKRERTAPAPVSSQVVGWPPIRAYRMNTLFKPSNPDKNENNESSNKKINHGNDKNDPPIKERLRLGFVKVNLDGLPIGRKVDLNAHRSYETLANALEEMFVDPSLCIRGGKDEPVQTLKLLDGSSEFVLTYEDKEGDWMLVGDVPWRMFLSTAKRLRIMRTSEANGLAPKFQVKNEKHKNKVI